MTAAKVHWEVIPGELAITTTEKVGYNSIMRACKRKPRLTAAQVRQRGLPVRLYLRNPLARFASAWAYFTANGHFPSPATRNSRPMEITIEDFIDQVLGGWENEHWAPQLAQHEIYTDIYLFENIAETWPHEHTRSLGHENRGRILKPVITHRYDELREYYRDDLEAWTAADR